MIEDFWNELNEGEIHARDSLQFELKSEFSINPHRKKTIYKQEVYLFIPNSLQVNSENYSKEQFYLDQTNLIRYKTPPMSLTDLVNFNYSASPLTRLHHILNRSDPHLFFATTSDELKLFAAIFRGTLRSRTYKIIKSIKDPKDKKKIDQMISYLCSEITEICHKFRELQEISRSRSSDPILIRHFRYVDEFISTAIEEFLVILLKQYRSIEYGNEMDQSIADLVSKEKSYRKVKKLEPKTTKGTPSSNESILYRQGLLHRFILESLILKNLRFSLEEKHRNILGAVAAGVAMMVYMTILAWHSTSFVINSFPFIALAVVLYILKDRIKEGFKTFYSRQSHRWFPDYSTEIESFKGFKIGRLTENFGFIEASQLPDRFLEIRNREFHEELQALHRHETIIQYKREITLYPPVNDLEGRRREITTIFRFNIHRFLQKASNAFQAGLIIDSDNREISEKFFPKIYHLNLIIRNSFLQEEFKPKIEIKAYRVVIDKNGIKRVEQIKCKSKI